MILWDDRAGFLSVSLNFHSGSPNSFHHKGRQLLMTLVGVRNKCQYGVLFDVESIT